MLQQSSVMATTFTCNSSPPVQLHRNSISRHSFTVIVSFPSYLTTSLYPRLCALKNGISSEKLRAQDAYSSDLLRKPIIQPVVDTISNDEPAGMSYDEEDDEEKISYKGRDEEELIDWEDKILEDTVPLVGFVRMILHSGKYESGDRFSPEHEKTIIDRLLQYHPEREKKIGFGIDYITIGYHPEFEGSRCLFIVRKDGQLIDFSYWKCVKGFIRKNYPLYADSFILRHFRRRNKNS